MSSAIEQCNAEETILRGQIAYLHFSSPTFSAGKLWPAGSSRNSPTVSFAGKLKVGEGDVVCLRGRWTTHPKYGKQFQVSGEVYEDKVTAAGLRNWLAGSDNAKGIGSVKADRIVREFGEDFERALAEEPERMAKVAKVPVQTILDLGAAWAKNREFNTVATKLSAYELSRHEIERLFDKFGVSILRILDDDPYQLLNHVSGFGFRKIDGISLKLGTPKDHPGRLKAGICHALAETLGEGSTCLDRGHLLALALDLLALDNLDAEAVVGSTIDSLADPDDGHARMLREIREPEADRVLYALPRPYAQELYLSDFLASGNRRNPNFPSEVVESLASPVDADGRTLDDSQFRAVVQALRKRICLISGGAGAGKTTIIKSIVRVYDDQDLDVALCAPTGKAARRMEQVIRGHEASTIHRLLEYRYDKTKGRTTFLRNADNPIAADVVIVDETSMLDVSLAWHLFQAIGDRTALVLVGDHHQLPPVGYGAVLRDCIANEIVPLSILSKCHRQAGTLKQNCSAILEGSVAPTELTGTAWYVHRKLQTPQEVHACIERLAAEILPQQFGYSKPEDIQFLTPIHNGELGTKNVNLILQRIRQRSLGIEVEPQDPTKRPRFYVGDKVINTKNNYTLNIMNGHQGIVLHSHPLVVSFDGHAVDIPAESQGEIELAYCITPHKAQGSEWPCIVTLVSKSHSYMHHRNWLYTAATRAQTTSIILGDEWGIRNAAESLKANQRTTLLGLFSRTTEHGH